MVGELCISVVHLQGLSGLMFDCKFCKRWTQWAMTPLEGCPTVFQTICSLPAGYHQYKFVVDGEWRHDEPQPSINSNIGTVNTILINHESDFLSPMLSAHIPLTGPVSTMDVDNETANRMVIALDVELPVKQAFHILHEQLGIKGSNLTEEELDTHTIYAWKDAKSYMNSQVSGQGGASTRQLVQAGPDDSFKSVALKILQNDVSTIPIINYPATDPSNPQLLHLASLSEILKCICRFFKHSPNSIPVLQSPICAIPLGTWVPKIGEPKGGNWLC